MNEVFPEFPDIDIRVFFDLDHPLRKGCSAKEDLHKLCPSGSYNREEIQNYIFESLKAKWQEMISKFPVSYNSRKAPWRLAFIDKEHTEKIINKILAYKANCLSSSYSHQALNDGLSTSEFYTEFQKYVTWLNQQSEVTYFDISFWVFPDHEIYFRDYCGLNQNKKEFSFELAAAHTVFNGIVHFEYFEFEKLANFRHTVFKKQIDFNNVVFQDLCSFYGTEFHSIASFEEVELKGKFIFEKIKIDNGIHFSGCQFFKEAIFNQLDLSHGLTFQSKSIKRVKFEDNVFFQSSVFGTNTNFQSVNFCKNASFIDITFNGRSNWHFCEFHDQSSFNSCRFKSHASFQNTIFKSLSSFIGAHFEDNCSFNATTFNGRVSFAGVLIEKKFSLNNISIQFLNSQEYSNSQVREINKKGIISFNGFQFTDDSSSQLEIEKINILDTEQALPESIFAFSNINTHAKYPININLGNLDSKNRAYRILSFSKSNFDKQSVILTNLYLKDVHIKEPLIKGISVSK